MFVELKRCMAEDVILAIPNETDPFMVEADASEGAVGTVLSQKQNGKWRPVAFMSKSLSATECNYKIYDKELLAIDEWRHYLMGAAVDVEIWMDHQNLQYFRQPQKLNRRQARWVTELPNTTFSFITSRAPSTRRPTYCLAATTTTKGRMTTEISPSFLLCISGHSSCPRPMKYIRGSRKPLDRKSYGTRASRPL